MSKIKNDGLDQTSMTKCKALTGSAVKGLTMLPVSRRRTSGEFSYGGTIFCSCHLDLDPMTLIYEPGVNILKMYLQFCIGPNKNKIYM